MIHHFTLDQVRRNALSPSDFSKIKRNSQNKYVFSVKLYTNVDEAVQILAEIEPLHFAYCPHVKLKVLSSIKRSIARL